MKFSTAYRRATPKSPNKIEVVHLGEMQSGIALRVGEQTYYLKKGDAVDITIETEKPVEKKGHKSYAAYPYGTGLYKPFPW